MVKIIGEDSPTPRQQGIKIDPQACEDVLCECGNATFVGVVLLKVIPALLTDGHGEMVNPTQQFACNSCGKIPLRLLGTAGGPNWFKKTDEDTEETKPISPIITSNIIEPS